MISSICWLLFYYLPPFSNVLVLPVLGVVDDSFALNIGIQTVIRDHTGLAEVSREFAVEAVEDGALRYDSSGIRTDVRVASSVDDLGVALDDI